MNAVGWALLWSSVPVTFVAATALVLERLASRRGPAEGSWVSAASLLVIVILTPIAICGLPQCWSWRMRSLVAPEENLSQGVLSRSTFIATGSANDSSRSADSESARGGLGWTMAWWHRLRDGASRKAASMRVGNSALPAACGVLALSGAVWCLGRLLLGLWGVRDCLRRCISIEDPDIMAQVESIRLELGVTRVVEVRELSGPASTTAAAVGWRRPFVLLAPDWRSWSGLERRAVLAHEVAHIARADYALGVVAQVGLSLHSYHPLVHWIIGRLRLQQELAADALGARLAGGRHRYLVALSRLALRPEESRLSWPARTFLPVHGHLIRRIQMLKEQSPTQHRAMPAAMRMVTMAILVVVGLTATAFRGTAPARGADPPPVITSTTHTNTPGFDLSYLPPDALGVVAVHPAAISRIPGFKSSFDKLNAAVADKIPGLPKLDSIEQASIEFSVSSRDQSKKQPGRILDGDWMIRSVEDFDWKTFVKKVVKLNPNVQELVEVRLHDQIYYTAKRFQFVLCFYFPDARTVVFSSNEEHVRRLIQQGSIGRPGFVRGKDWQQVDRGLIAVAIDNSQRRWKLDALTADPADLPIAPLLQNASRWVFGADATDVLKLRAIATCSDESQGEALAHLVQGRMALALAALNGPVNASPPEKERAVEALVPTAKRLLQACRVRRTGAVVDLSSERKVDAHAIAELFRSGL